MSLSSAEQALRDRFFPILLQEAFRLQEGPDREVALEALIEATEMLREHLQRELTAFREEQTE